MRALQFWAHGRTGVLHATQDCSGRGDVGDPVYPTREEFEAAPKCRTCRPIWHADDCRCAGHVEVSA